MNERLIAAALYMLINGERHDSDGDFGPLAKTTTTLSNREVEVYANNGEKYTITVRKHA